MRSQRLRVLKAVFVVGAMVALGGCATPAGGAATAGSETDASASEFEALKEANDPAGQSLASMGSFGNYVNTLGITADVDEWTQVRERDCTATTSGATDRWLPSSVPDAGVDEGTWWIKANAVWAAAIAYYCPDALANYQMTDGESMAYGTLYYYSVLESGEATGADVHAAPTDPRDFFEIDESPIATGNTVVCADGWISPSGGKQGACSHHGGIG